MKNFAGKVVVVTGAASGMGRAISVEMARRGARLAISDMDPIGLEETTKLIEATGAQVHSQLLNVAEREAFLEYAETVAQHFGVVNVVFNNAGIAHHGEVERTEFKTYDKVMDVDFWGVVNGTKAFLPHLIASGDGHIVNTSSLFGLIAIPGQSAYNAAKFAVRGFTESLAMEMRADKRPVKVSSVHPGGIKTAIARNATVNDGADQTKFAALFDKKLARLTSEQAADIIIKGVEKDKVRILVGTDAVGLDAMVRVLGSLYQRVVVVAATKILR